MEHSKWINIRHFLLDGIAHFMMLVFVLLTSVFVTKEILTALVFIECGSICKAICFTFYYHERIRDDVRLFIRYVIPGAIVLLVYFLVGAYATDKRMLNLVDYIAKIAVVVLVVYLVVPIISEEKSWDRFILKYRRISSAQRVLYNLMAIISRGLIIIGFLLVIFAKSYSNFYYESLVIIGCAVWYGRKVLGIHCTRNCEQFFDCDTNTNVPQATTNSGQKSGGSGLPMSEREVRSIVQRIADRWSYREDRSSMVSGGGSIRYNVTVDVSSSFITFTINGTLSGVREEQLSSAKIHLSGKMDDAAYKIAQEAKNELAKHNNLPYSYDISVRKGYIQ